MLHEQRFFFLASRAIAFAILRVYGRSPFTGYLTNVISPTFTFLTTFRRACDAAGSTHGQALPLLAFRLSGAANRAFSSAHNSNAAHRTYAMCNYGSDINWLLAKYTTFAVMASAYHDIIKMRQPDNESPTALGSALRHSATA